MTESLYAWLGANYPILLIIVVVAITVWWIASKYYDWKKRIEDIQKECAKIDGELSPRIDQLTYRVDHLTNRLDHVTYRLDNVTYRLDNVTDRLDDMSYRLDQLTDNLNTLNLNFQNLLVFLKSKFGKKDLPLFISQSPIKLTELAERILYAIEGQKFVDQNITRLFKAMDLMNVKTALDVQNNAPSTIYKLSSEPSFKPIKDYLFQNPVYRENINKEDEIEIDLDFATVVSIMGMYLRDKYLAIHPELNPGNIPALNYSL